LRKSACDHLEKVELHVTTGSKASSPPGILMMIVAQFQRVSRIVPIESSDWRAAPASAGQRSNRGALVLIVDRIGVCRLWLIA
jgi:hypothetical protein